jgi:hypothetical protein
MAMRSYNVPDNAGCHVHVGSPLLALTHKVRAFLFWYKPHLVAPCTQVDHLGFAVLRHRELLPAVFAFHVIFLFLFDVAQVT